MHSFTCEECKRPSVCEDRDENAGTGLCYDCFEAAVEAADERRRERIARANEY